MQVQTRRTRRTAEEGREFRLQLVEAARTLFDEQGFDAVSIRKITQQAGCSPMTFYVYFRNKRELLRHIWGDIVTLADEHAQSAIDESTSIPEQIVAFACAWIEYWPANPENFRILFLNQDRLASDDDIYFARSSRARQFAPLVEKIEWGIADGVFEEIDPIAASQAIVTSSVGLAYSLIMVPEAGWRKGLAETTIRLIVQGLGNKR